MLQSPRSQCMLIRMRNINISLWCRVLLLPRERLTLIKWFVFIFLLLLIYLQIFKYYVQFFNFKLILLVEGDQSRSANGL